MMLHQECHSRWKICRRKKLINKPHFRCRWSWRIFLSMQRSTDNSNWTDISSAVEKTYGLTDTDGNKYVRIKLSYKDLGTTETLYGSSSQVENVNAEPTGNIVISGTATEGNTLTPIKIIFKMEMD